jgi:hypothetical protein
MRHKYTEIEELMTSWFSKPAGGRSFNDRFSFEGYPLGWFYEKLFFPEILPKPLNPHGFLKNGKHFGTIDKARFSATLFALRKGIMFNEMMKMKRVSGTTQKGEVLFLSYTNYVLKDDILHRIQEVVDIVEKPFVLLADPLSHQVSRKCYSFPFVYDYVDETIIRRVKNVSSQLYDSLQNVPENDKEDMFTISSGSIWQEMKYLYDFYFSREMLFFFVLYYELFKKIIIAEGICAAVLTSSNSLVERCCIAAARTCGVSSVIIQHGAGLANRKLTDICDSRFAVFGFYYKERLVNYGIAPQNVTVVGPLIYNKITPFVAIKNTREKILITTQPLVEVDLIEKQYYFKHMTTLFDALARLNMPVVVKLHPREKYVDDYEKIVSRYNHVTLSTTHNVDHLYTLMTTAAVMINFYGSSTVVEAAILDVPTITLQLPGMSQQFYRGYDPTLRLTFEDGMDVLVSSVKEMIANASVLRDKRRILVEHWCYKIDGKAAQRVALLISSLTR